MRTPRFASLAALLVPLSFAAAGEPTQITLENARLAIALDTASRGAVVSVRDKTTGRQLAAAKNDPVLFQMEVSQRGDPQGKRSTLSSRDAAQFTLQRETEGARSVGRLTFTNVAGRGIDVVCTVAVRPDDPWLRWRLEARLPESLVLETVRFPCVVLRVPTGAAAPGALVLGSTKGGVDRRMDSRSVGQSVSATQPGNLAAQFGCYYDDAGGVATAALDARGYRKTIAATRTAEGLMLAWHQPCFSTSRYTQDYDIVWTTFGSSDPARAADWRDAADLYKQWAVRQPWCARTYAARDDLPAWLKQGPAMVRFGREWLSKPESIESWLKDYWRAKFGQSVPLIIAYWGWEKLGAWVTPEYFPVYPSDEAFRRLTRLGRELGGHAFLWPSGYHYTLTYMKRPDGRFDWDDRARFDATVRPHAVCGRDGSALIGERFWLHGGQTATLCGGDPWTIDWFNRTAVGCVERGAELVQVDQVVGGAFPVCYSTQHGHAPGPGCWPTEAFHRQLRTMLAACREVEPGSVVCFEEPNEQFIQEVGIQDYRDWEAFRPAFRHQQQARPEIEPASVFGYLYHEYLPCFQSNPRPRDRLQSAYCLVNGQIPHLIPSRHSGPGPLLGNAGFEDSSGSQLNDWTRVEGYQGRAYTGLAARDDKVFHGGRASLRLTNTEPGQIAQVAQNVDVGGAFQPGRTYRVSAWIKSGGLKQSNAIGLAALAAGMNPLGSWHVPMPQAAGDWTRGQADFKLPEGSRLLRIMLHLNGPGTIWLDDMALEEVAADGTTAIVMRPDEPTDHELMRQWVELFYGAGRPYLLLGKMLRPPRLETVVIESQGGLFPAILHNTFEAPDGSRAVVLVNVSETRQTGKLTWSGQTRSVSLQPWEVRLVR